MNLSVHMRKHGMRINLRMLYLMSPKPSVCYYLHGLYHLPKRHIALSSVLNVSLKYILLLQTHEHKLEFAQNNFLLKA
jgi:hypothetical protein